MANTLSKTGISSAATIKSGHVSQSVDAFTGLKEYDITVSGSSTLTGSFNLSGSLTTTGSFNLSGSSLFKGNITHSGLITGSDEIYATNVLTDGISHINGGLTIAANTTMSRNLSGSTSGMQLSYNTASFERLVVNGEVTSSAENQFTVNDFLRLVPRTTTPHPSLAQTGSIILSGSGATLALYVYIGGVAGVWNKVDWA